MKKQTWIILVALGIGGYFIVKNSAKHSAAVIATANNPAAVNAPKPTIAQQISAYTGAASSLFGFLTDATNNSGSSNSSITTPANTAAQAVAPADPFAALGF